MGIDSVAIKTFNSSGSQSVCRASTADNTKLIESEFLTKCTTTYMNGSGMSFIPGSLENFPVAGASTLNTETYLLPSDVDAISEIILHMKFSTNAIQISSTFLLDLINKIEMKAGNLTFQKILPGDIYARNLTENGNYVKVEHSGQKFAVGSGDFEDPNGNAAIAAALAAVPSPTTTNADLATALTAGVPASAVLTAVTTDSTTTPPANARLPLNTKAFSRPGHFTTSVKDITDNGTRFFDFSISIPFTGRSSDLNGSFLQAGAITNSLSMKVTYNHLPNAAARNTLATPSTQNAAPALIHPDTGHAVADNAGGFTGSNSSGTTLATTDFSTGVCVFTHQMTSTEKNFIQNNIINRVVRASQNKIFAQSFSTSRDNEILTLDLSDINLNVSHILITLQKGIFGTSSTANTNTQIGNFGDVNGTCWTPRETSTKVNAQNPTTASTIDVRGTVGGDAAVSEDLGVLKGWLKGAELLLGNDRTGNIPVSCLTTNKLEQFGLTSVDNKNIYIIKLAGTAFSTAGIPFSRLNNKKLLLTLNKLIVESNATGECVLNVTCCGTQVQTTVGGSTSFSA